MLMKDILSRESSNNIEGKYNLGEKSVCLVRASTLDKQSWCMKRKHMQYN